VDISIPLQKATKKEKFSRALLLKNYRKIGDALFAERPKKVSFRLNESESTIPIITLSFLKRIYGESREKNFYY